MVSVNKIIKRLTVFALVLVVSTNNASSQTLEDSIRQDFVAINKTYDSAFYLTFDVDIIYHTDDTIYAGTDSADYQYSEMQGTYTFHQQKALYKLGDMEYMQNDTFTVALYKANQFLLVGKKNQATQTPGSFVPTKALVDSLMVQMGNNYIFYRYVNDSTTQITFVANDSNWVYKEINIEFESATHYLKKIDYSFKDFGYSQGDPLLPPYRSARMYFYFRNYRVEHVGNDVFDESKYIRFDGPNTIVPADAYKNYTIYKNY